MYLLGHLHVIGDDRSAFNIIFRAPSQTKTTPENQLLPYDGGNRPSTSTCPAMLRPYQLDQTLTTPSSSSPWSSTPALTPAASPPSHNTLSTFSFPAQHPIHPSCARSYPLHTSQAAQKSCLPHRTPSSFAPVSNLTGRYLHHHPHLTLPCPAEE